MQLSIEEIAVTDPMMSRQRHQHDCMITFSHLVTSTTKWCYHPQGTLVLIGGPTPRNITTFAVLYVVGNVIALCATGFLLGKIIFHVAYLLASSLKTAVL
jgi:hypothetical protein